MQFLTDTDDIDIDVHSMIMDIDDIMHREITDRSGITVNHRDIRKFVVGIINKNNKCQSEIRRRDKELRDDIKNFDKIYTNKKAQGKVVKDLNSIGNIIKFYIFGYIIIRD